MRLAIVAGLIVGASLAVRSAAGAHAMAETGHAARAVRVHEPVVAPWYIATDDGHGAGSRRNLVPPPRRKEFARVFVKGLRLEADEV